MALSSNPHRSSIFAEFGTNTRTDIGVSANQSLNLMHQHIFGAGSYSRDDFGGKGQPQISSVNATTPAPAGDGGKCNISFTLDTGGILTTVQIQYRLVGGSGWTDHPNGTMSWSSNNTYNFAGLQMPEINRQYEFRIEYYNDFISNSSDWKYSGSDTAFSSLPNKWATPTISYASAGTYVYVEWFYGDVPPTFSLQSRSDSTSWTTRTLQSSANWGTYNPKEGTWTFDGDRIRIRADAYGSTNASEWSAPYFL